MYLQLLNGTEAKFVIVQFAQIPFELTLCFSTLQMEAEQARLQNDLQRQSDNYNLILTRRDREHQEEDNLATMLRSDVERLAAER